MTHPMSRNKYPGTCRRCGRIVGAGEGYLWKRGGKWQLEHADFPGDGRVTCAAARLDEENLTKERLK